MASKNLKKEKWEEPLIEKMVLKLTEGKFDNSGIEIEHGNPGGGLVGPGS